MNEEAITTISRMRAITVSREYGSGGGEIAARLAKRLGWQLIDHALVERVASELGTSLEEAEAHDEQREGVIVQLLNSMQYIYPAYTASAAPTAFLSDDVASRETVNKLVRAAAARGHVVIVGRAAQEIAKGLATGTCEPVPATGLSRYPAPPKDFPSPGNTLETKPGFLEMEEGRFDEHGTLAQEPGGKPGSD